MAIGVPQDMMIGIQCRLGVKDLVRFKCVSKSWCSLIHDPYFIKLHLSHSSNSFDLELFDDLFNSLTFQKVYLDGDKLFGSCNGLLALYKPCDITELEKIWLRNPSTGESRMLPSTGTKLPSLVDWFWIVYGFGYDPISDDYKIIQMVQCDYFAPIVTLYSSRTNSWKRIQDFPCIFGTYEPANGVLVNNSLHWVASRSLDFQNMKPFVVVVAFDLVAEEYSFIELPDCLKSSKRRFLHLYIRANKGRLFFISTHFGRVFDIWVMKEYGVKQSWTKLISLRQSSYFELRNKIVDNVRIGELLCLNVVESLVPVTSPGNEDSMDTPCELENFCPELEVQRWSSSFFHYLFE